MSQVTKYDEVLSSILVNEKSILGFLSAVFGFLARRTDFYYVPQGQYENMGFPPGVAEELVIKVLRSCDPNSKKAPNGARKPLDINNEIMCSTVAQEVEVITEGDEINDEEYEPSTSDHQYAAPPHTQIPAITKSDTNPDKSIPKDELDTTAKAKNSPKNPPKSDPDVSKASREPKDIPKETPSLGPGGFKASEVSKEPSKVAPDGYKPPMIPTQKNSETYNGAEREKYSWSQNIMELDVTLKLPPDVKSSKDLKVTINAGDVSVIGRNGDIIIKDTLPWKIKALDSFWSISEGNLLMHLEKVQERWWNKFLNGEDAIDLDLIDCSRPLDELPQDHIDKVRELQWNQERKIKGLPTSDEIRNIEILKKAWNAPGSPFQGQEFDPSVLSKKPPNFSEEES